PGGRLAGVGIHAVYRILAWAAVARKFMQIVDRRLNPKSKSLGNRQRFLRRAKAEIREAIKDSLKSRRVSEAEGAEKVTIRSKSLREPSFSLGRNSGRRYYVLPGNEEYQVG